MKISNKTKDMILIILFLVGLLILFIMGVCAFVSAIRNINKANAAILDEYNCRPIIIRAETEQDRFHNRQWRKQWCDYYEVSEDRLEDILDDPGNY